MEIDVFLLHEDMTYSEHKAQLKELSLRIPGRDGEAYSPIGGLYPVTDWIKVKELPHPSELPALMQGKARYRTLGLYRSTSAFPATHVPHEQLVDYCRGKLRLIKGWYMSAYSSAQDAALAKAKEGSDTFLGWIAAGTATGAVGALIARYLGVSFA